MWRFGRASRSVVIATAMLSPVAVTSTAADYDALSRHDSDRPARISRWPCRLIAAPTVRKLIDAAWDRSETVRQQCEDLAAARAVVVVQWGSGDSQTHATTEMAVRDGVVVATIRVPPFGDSIVLLAHELEHVVEKTRGVDFEAEVDRPGARVWRASGGYETQAAVDVSRRVAQELRGKP